MAERNGKKKNLQNLKWATAHLSRRLGAGRWARGRVAGARRAWVHGRALQAAMRAGAGRSGRTELAGAQQAERAAGGARGRLGERQQARGARQQARRGARQAQAGARGAAGWAASAHLGMLNWARLGFCAP